jgi:FkbM family methyltransferase
MSLKRRLVRALDAPGGRTLLGKVATRRARGLLGRRDVIVAHRGVWVHQVGDYVVPDGPRFEYDERAILSWKDQVPKYLRNADDYWFRDYTPRPGDVIVDVGAGRGEDVLAFSQRVGPTGRVLALEAHPATCRLLAAFCALNSLRNVTVVNAALMDRPGSVTIEDVDDWRKNTVGGGAGAGAAVPATTLADLCRDQGVKEIAFLKMNIEGAERQALGGMEPVLDRIRHLCICCHDFRAEKGEGEHYRTRAFVEAFLSERGFAVSSRSGDRRAWVRDHLSARRRGEALA